MSDEHRFGGDWTEIKLDVLDAYSGFFSTALKNQQFTRWYIDGFAGTGRRTQAKTVGGLFEAEPVDVKEFTLEGSARRALAVQPEYDHLVLIEQRKGHFAALQQMAAEYPDRDLKPIRGDANDVLPAIFAAEPWVGRHASAQRAVVFLDPYGINVDFSTLKCLASCRKADVWLLVNLKALIQQLAHDHGAMDAGKRDAVTRFLGTPDWEAAFYAFEERGEDLFSQARSRAGKRAIDRQEVARFYRERLHQTFAYVSDPLALKVGSRDDYFHLYCMSNSASDKAIALIKRGAEGVLRKHGKASRHRSGP